MRFRALRTASAGSVVSILLVFSRPLLAQTDICMPQFVDGTAAGLRWQTTLILHNQTTVRAQVMLQLHSPAGQPLSGLMMNRLGPGGMRSQFGPNGQFNPGPINARSMLAYRSAGMGPLQTGFLQIRSQDRIQAHLMLHVFDSGGNLASDTAIIPHTPLRIGNLWMEPFGGSRFGMALANPSDTTPATVTLEFFAEDGTIALATATLQLGIRMQITRFVDEWLADIPPGTVGFVRITATSPICGMALQLRGLAMTQVPILIEN